MFVVRRSFRNYGEMMLPGSIVEPGSIKRFKTRLKDRDIVEVLPHNLSSWNRYFLDKFGVSLIKAEPVEEAPKAKPIEEAPKVTIQARKPVVAVLKK